jgi:hypothetical protein
MAKLNQEKKKKKQEIIPNEKREKERETRTVFVV